MYNADRLSPDSLFALTSSGEFNFTTSETATSDAPVLDFSNQTLSLENLFSIADSKPDIIPYADSVPGDSTTTATIEVNGQITGTIEDAADQDFYRVELVAGVTYEIFQLRGGENPMDDPYLRLYDMDGATQIAENDDILNAAGEQATRNSKITYTPTESGTYFLVADRWDPNSGPDNSVGAGDYTIYVNADGYRPEGTLDELAFFLTDQFDIRASWNQTTITYDVSNLPAAVQVLALAAMQLWEDVTPLDFVQATGVADLTFTDDESGAFASTALTNGFISSSTVNISNSQWVNVHGTDLNSYTFETYIHEVGHAIGLGHGGPYNGSATYGRDNVYARDLANFSIMSYNQQTPGEDAAFQGTPRLVLGLQIVDIIAVQNLYGANPDGTRSGDTIYGFNSNAGGLFDFSDFNGQGIRPPALSIYDTGGYDTLDFSGYSAPQRINLNAEEFSDIGNNTNLGGNVPLINILSIARDTVIEAAIGGSGNDFILGNSVENALTGGGGNDQLLGDAVTSLSLDSTAGQLFRAYQAVFDRSPDEGGFNAFLTEMRLGNTTQEAVIAEFVSSAEFEQTYGELNNQGFVEQLYRNVLDREGDAAGIAAFTASIDGGTSRAAVVTEFANSPEFVQLMALPSASFSTNVIINPAEAQIFRIYQAVFDRDPDEGGFTAFTNALQVGALTAQAITAEFVASAEFQQTYGSLDNAGFVELLFTNVLPGNTDAQGRADFTEALDTGTLTRAAMVAEFVESFEFVQRMDAPATEFVAGAFTNSGDMLDGGAGNDILFGGRGADSFVFDTQSGGADTILDFTSGTDTLDLGANADFDSFDEIIAAGTQAGQDTLFDFGNGNTLTLENVTLSELNEADFGLLIA